MSVKITITYSSLLRARIHTGRRHQVRRHLHHLAHQVIGDTKYGKGKINRSLRETYGLPRMFLHAALLELRHPATDEPLRLEAPLADDLRAYLLRALVGRFTRHGGMPVDLLEDVAQDAMLRILDQLHRFPRFFHGGRVGPRVWVNVGELHQVGDAKCATDVFQVVPTFREFEKGDPPPIPKGPHDNRRLPRADAPRRAQGRPIRLGVMVECQL